MTASLRDVLLTPVLARRWLEPTPKLNDDLVRSYADAMTAGDWRGGSIVVRTPDGLHDGKHRCAAVAVSGCSVWVREVFVRNADDTCQPGGSTPSQTGPTLPIQAIVPDLFRR
jgi:hypothetical protein